MSQKIITVGNVNLDIIMGPLENWPHIGTEVVLPKSEFRKGGSAGNTALALEALGCDHCLMSNMGGDFVGSWLTEQFTDIACHWSFCDLPTTYSVGITHPDGERTFFTSQGHLNAFCWDDIRDSLDSIPVGGTTILFTGTFLSPRLMADYTSGLAGLRKRGARIALDTGWPTNGWTKEVRSNVLNWLTHCDEILFNEAEVCGLFGCSAEDISLAAADMVERMPVSSTLIIKQGAKGASAWRKDQTTIYCPGQQVVLVDSIGAGDCFNAGYLAARVMGSELRTCVARGIQVATNAISTQPRRYC